MDITPDNSLVNWIMGYLNCQGLLILSSFLSSVYILMIIIVIFMPLVVHHLFPNMPQFRQPEVSAMLVDWAKKHDIKYTIVSYFDAWR